MLGCCGGVVPLSLLRSHHLVAENIGRHTTSNYYIWLLVVACARRRPHPGNCFDQQAKLCKVDWKRDVFRKGSVYPHQCMKLLWVKLSRAVIRRGGSSGQPSTHLQGLTVESRRQLCDGCSWRRAQYIGHRQRLHDVWQGASQKVIIATYCAYFCRMTDNITHNRSSATAEPPRTGTEAFATGEGTQFDVRAIGYDSANLNRSRRFELGGTQQPIAAPNNRKNRNNIGIWNVRTFRQTGKQHLLIK